MYIIAAVTKTEIINLLVGNNDCTRVPMKRRGSLSFVISNPNSDEVDVVCPIYVPGNQCYSPEICNNFNIAPFFRICEDVSANLYTLCFVDVSTQLNRLRLDFFVATWTFCSLSVNATRTYVRSFELRGECIYFDIPIW